MSYKEQCGTKAGHLMVMPHKFKLNEPKQAGEQEGAQEALSQSYHYQLENKEGARRRDCS